MVVRLRSRRSWVVCIVGIIAAGLLSRAVHTGFVVFDKYLGDALYAAMVYAMLRLFGEAKTAAVGAAVLLTAIELFQLTMIPARMFANGDLLTRTCARLLGVQFGFLDLAAYAVGIIAICHVDCSGRKDEGETAETLPESGWRDNWR